MRADLNFTKHELRTMARLLLVTLGDEDWSLDQFERALAQYRLTLTPQAIAYPASVWRITRDQDVQLVRGYLCNFDPERAVAMCCYLAARRALVSGRQKTA